MTSNDKTRELAIAEALLVATRADLSRLQRILAARPMTAKEAGHLANARAQLELDYRQVHALLAECQAALPDPSE